MTGDVASNAASAPVTAAGLFAIVWDALVDVLGSAATAALIRRASKRAGLDRREADLLRIRREGFEYTYAVPDAWKTTSGLTDLRRLTSELSPLLVELTGPVVIRHLNRIPELEISAIRFGQEHSS